MNKTAVLKVGSKTNIYSLATSISGNIKSDTYVYMDVIGVEANYIALKALINARGQLMLSGYDISYVPYLHDFKIDTDAAAFDSIRKGIRWVIKGSNTF